MNLKGVLWGIKPAVPNISGGGSIINVSSHAGYFGTPMYKTCATTKSVLIGVTKTAALVLAQTVLRLP